MKRWPWQEEVLSTDPTYTQLVYVIRSRVRLAWRVWAVRVENRRIIVTLRRRGGTVEMPFNPSDSAELVTQRLIAWRRDLFDEHGSQAMVGWYRDFMKTLRTIPECHGLSISISTSGHFVRWSLDELTGAAEIYGTVGAEIAEIVARDVARTQAAAQSTTS